METRIKIQNLKCGGCEKTIIKNISEIEGVSAVSVDHQIESVSVQYNSEKTLDEVKLTLNNLGYPEESSSNSLGKKAKSYISCAVGRLKTK